MKLKHVICGLALLMGSVSASYSQQHYQPSPENLKNREWFEQSRFGVFIHWGVYSVLGDGEWVMNNQNISLDEYALLPKFFNQFPSMRKNGRSYLNRLEQSISPLPPDIMMDFRCGIARFRTIMW
jgi:hypothetical protein